MFPWCPLKYMSFAKISLLLWAHNITISTLGVSAFSCFITLFYHLHEIEFLKEAAFSLKQYQAICTTENQSVKKSPSACRKSVVRAVTAGGKSMFWPVIAFTYSTMQVKLIFGISNCFHIFTPENPKLPICLLGAYINVSKKGDTNLYQQLFACQRQRKWDHIINWML